MFLLCKRSRYPKTKPHRFILFENKGIKMLEEHPTKIVWNKKIYVKDDELIEEIERRGYVVIKIGGRK